VDVPGILRDLNLKHGLSMELRIAIGVMAKYPRISFKSSAQKDQPEYNEDKTLFNSGPLSQWTGTIEQANSK
jgi:hypothetical protein